MSLETHSRIMLSPLYRLQWEETQGQFVLLYPEGMVELNRPAAEILQCCDGTRQLEDIVKTLEEKFETTGLRSDIEEMLEDALRHGWIRYVP